ncbi:flavin monoamine oxidase family protein [Sphingomonas immobilis]|uniref:FAD-dependent oxidoreductase n=1 Tax=Sphingomonas immobilis TaxID=3063997 RepID=A0ABT8ZVZ0_9SPHN|nr:FAD-dependent oxidoreductase [Sphingomonas sp. CA1-15]MDO7841382.1 FAD-dependent oxidoreductase [Sphingomonas sp. CA1-15]
MRGGGIIWDALAAARRLNLAANGDAMPVVGAPGATRRAVLTALGAAGVAAALPRKARGQGIAPGPVAIVGGGIAGLSALWTLTQAGIDARLYEARPRMGGRIWTARPAKAPAIEMGGQLVNDDHADMHALTKAFGIALIDRKAGAHRTMILAGGKALPDARLVAGLRGIAAQIDADSQRLDKDYAAIAAELDAMSFTGYLDKHARLMPAPWVRALMEQTARTEYGCEPDEASAIELVFNLPSVDGRRVEVLSNSDERYLIAGGSGALIDAMAERLRNRITTGAKVARIDPFGGGVRLVFADGRTTDASDVIVATPAGITRAIDFRVALPPLWTRFIAEVGLGKCEKVQAVMAARPWEASVGRGGELWETRAAPMALGWDAGIRPGTGPGSIWTWFLGGQQVNDAAGQTGHMLARRFAAQVERAIPGMAAATREGRRTNWCGDPMTMGAYVNFRPGQLTTFGGLIWSESDGVASSPLGAGPVHFAGEHLSDAYPGYMNGGAQTGRLAAQTVIAARVPARRFG